MKKLSDVFKELLKEKGIDKIGSLSRRIPKRDSSRPLQEIAIAVLEGKGVIVKVNEPTTIAWDLEGKPTKGALFAYLPLNSSHLDKFEVVIEGKDLKEKLSQYRFPYFIIDLMHWEKHTEKEKRKVALQASQSYGVIRDYLWGDRLAVTWVNEEFKKLSNFPLEKVTAYEGSTWEFLKKEGIEEVVLLDPWAGEDLNEEDFSAGAFIIGGIVDTGGTKKKTTPKIGEELEKRGIKVLRRKISLRGDIIGVPDRINLILEIVLKMILEGKPMDDAVLEVQSPLHAKWRLRKELPKHKKRFLINGKKFLVVEKELFDEYSKWLNIRWEDFVQVLRELNFVALERKRIQHLNKISTPRIINGKLYRVILLKKAMMLCYNC
ncbi:tRNA (guanine-N2)-dimethyltransferase [Thermococcus aggregans]|uniref:tRNA (Guanine-N2)-dimethyltransferase n=1 Tax=Thermococcus aggregans TaxID=110163 RepID=A0A9E7MZ42_THEAG|nr:tRNA (guanine(9)-/adenine(9)-N1)-methyltransferase [Thermococcus aggregans]USS41671.1 tRNA (guanine-N2)-dimethyltransferase [Thermococcus aggregans]